MNINVSLPTIIPNQLQPQTESARTDNRRAALIPQSRQSEAFNAESEVGSQKEKSRASQANPNQTSQQARDGAQTGNPQAAVDNRFVEATGEDGQRNKQQDPTAGATAEAGVAGQGAGRQGSRVRSRAGAPEHLVVSMPAALPMSLPWGRMASVTQLAVVFHRHRDHPRRSQSHHRQDATGARRRTGACRASAQDLSVARSAAAKEAQARKALLIRP